VCAPPSLQHALLFDGSEGWFNLNTAPNQFSGLPGYIFADLAEAQTLAKAYEDAIAYAKSKGTLVIGYGTSTGT
jgi:hypothetical protein